MGCDRYGYHEHSLSGASVVRIWDFVDTHQPYDVGCLLPKIHVSRLGFPKNTVSAR
jgi:hypothetical protein